MFGLSFCCWVLVSLVGCVGYNVCLDLSCSATVFMYVFSPILSAVCKLPFYINEEIIVV